MHTHAHQGTPCMVCRTRTCTLTSELHEGCAAAPVSLTPRCLHPSRPSRRDEISRSNVNDPHYANTACHRYAARQILSLCPMYTADSPRNRQPIRQPASRDTIPTQVTGIALPLSALHRMAHVQGVVGAFSTQDPSPSAHNGTIESPDCPLKAAGKRSYCHSGRINYRYRHCGLVFDGRAAAEPSQAPQQSRIESRIVSASFLRF